MNSTQVPVRLFLDYQSLISCAHNGGVWQSDTNKSDKRLLVACLQYCKSLNIPVVTMPENERVDKQTKLPVWGKATWKGSIKMNPEMPPDRENHVIIHELGHHKAGHTDGSFTKGRPWAGAVKREGELIAESISYLVLGAMGTNIKNHSTEYIRYFFSHQTQLQRAANRHEVLIVTTANEIINGINQYL